MSISGVEPDKVSGFSLLVDKTDSPIVVSSFISKSVSVNRNLSVTTVVDVELNASVTSTSFDSNPPDVMENKSLSVILDILFNTLELSNRVLYETDFQVVMLSIFSDVIPIEVSTFLRNFSVAPSVVADTDTCRGSCGRNFA